MATTQDKHLKKIDELEKRIKDLEKQIVKPMFKVGDIVIFEGYRKVEILEIMYREHRSLFRPTQYQFVYRGRFTQTNHVYFELPYGTREVFFSDHDILFNQEDLKPVPPDYETYLVHMIYDLCNEKKELK